MAPSALPIIDLSPLTVPSPSPTSLTSLSTALSTAFSTTGFAYLTHPPLSFTHAEILALAQSFFALPDDVKMSVAKRNFRRENRNTYRGYFPVQEGKDNCKEGFEIGTGDGGKGAQGSDNGRVGNGEEGVEGRVDLEEGNVWPDGFEEGRGKLELLHRELQALAGRLMSLLAMALGKDEGVFDVWTVESLSTLRLLHYPAALESQQGGLSCTPHTDSGLLTLLFQDSTGGLEVLSTNDNGKETWNPAPYVEGSIVVNVGDLMEKVSGGQFKATAHRVRKGREERWSVPFFAEPGRECVVGSVVEGGGKGEGVVYGRHVVGKMEGWVEFAGGDGEDGKVGKGLETGEVVSVGA